MAPYAWPFRFTSTTRRHSSGFSSSNLGHIPTPATWTHVSIRPYVAAACSATACTYSNSATSASR